MLKTGQVAEILGVSRQRVVDLCERGDLHSTWLGKHRRIRRSDLDEFTSRRSLTREQHRQLWMHQAMLTHLLTHPEEVMDLARKNIDRWQPMHRTDGKTAEYLHAWKKVLDDGLGATVEMMTSTSPRACELRQNSPFAGVLNQEERVQALRSFRSVHKSTSA